MGVLSKAHSARNDVVIEDPQHAKMNALWVVPRGKTKGVFGIEPAVIGMPS